MVSDVISASPVPFVFQDHLDDNEFLKLSESKDGIKPARMCPQDQLALCYTGLFRVDPEKLGRATSQDSSDGALTLQFGTGGQGRQPLPW